VSLPKSSELVVLVAGLVTLAGALGMRRILLPPHPAGPIYRVVIEPFAFDFKEVRQGQKLAHTFRLKNEGDVPVAIVKTQVSCSCTTIEGIDGRVIAAHQAVDVPVTLRTGSDDGPQTGSITLYHRRADQADAPVHYTEARVAARVTPDYRVRPTLLDFGTVDHLQPVTRTILLRPEAFAGVRVTSISSTSPAFSARELPAATGERDHPIAVTFSGRTLWQSGPLSAILHVDTNSPGAPITQVLARARFAAPVVVEPASIVVGPNVVGRVERSIRVVASRPVRITGLHCSDARVVANSSGLTDGRNIAVNLMIANATSGAIDTEVRVDLGPGPGAVASEARTVIIPVHRLAPLER